jgi:protein-disulfide isomerase
MNRISAIFTLLILSLSIAAQKPDDILATATNQVFRLSDLPEQVRAAAASMSATLAKARTNLFEQMINQRLVEIEAKALGKSAFSLIAAERAKAPRPAEAQIKAVYEANRDALGDKTLEQSRKQIVAFLRSEPEQKAVLAFVTRLQTKYKPLGGKDVNAKDLVPTDVVATVAGKPITANEFEAFARVKLFEIQANLADLIADELHETIFNTLVGVEAKAAGLDSSSFIAREITNKMKDFSDEERAGLESALTKRLFEKYKVNILHKELDPPVEKVLADDDPAVGPADAPVTIIMFSDFQCSACAATHPVLKEAMAPYEGKIRFVVRDFPLESIHENAFAAARAAAAANAQGKFFEFIEILYKNQDAQDNESLKKYAAEIGLNAAQFDIDFNSPKVAGEIRKDMADGEALGITSTPTIFVNGRRVRHISPDGFRAAIERALAK